ncbi:beta-ketoacyl-[acyl-carrier-protein] synthase family protein [Streptomyces anulatus]|uniref:beta-ketoacyl-[acyl-carrier-protein] synthase family protein n=1 Tax=Streptomyces TaxID=1883 RepID=UPI00067DC3DC|nr:MULTISPECIES: beta-ketoacyl-[acyl-carrier-protein] synthase family protein [Streptomyces]KND31387.1 3-oxoacyl-ACP synthase [Streptomyces europaeiscabiei]MDF9805111.1 3-oxoacyl-[acyl-carrier-protein] synthase II [Streptomyces sp. HB372]KPL31186.1 3-oxoacyl-ACP synthase [Streptomyces anulatus]KQX37346.1 3-oxoacyl-ACP synthase [Streptomyces sp. Root1295]KRA43586.1 3-oxoacyl-ACP synthase [Streptomyces sp. Root63]
MARAEIAVSGLGLVTPGGVGVGQSWEAALAGRPAAALDPALKGGIVRLSCRVPEFDAEELLGARRALRLDPFVQFALVAAREAVADAGLDPATWDGARVGVVLGCADGGPGTVETQHRVLLHEGPTRVSPLVLPMQLPNMLAGQAAIEFGATGPNLVVATACASGATAIGTARDLLLLDRCDIVLAGGSEAMITPLVMAGFARMGALSRREDDPATASRPFDADRDGFVAGEGAGVVVLERAADARARGARVRALIAGYGSAADAHHMTSPHPGGRGVEAAIRTAIEDAGAHPRDVQHVNAHGTSTPLNDLAEAQTLRRVLPGTPLVSSTKGVTGHLLGAAGAVEAAFGVLSIENGVVPPTAGLRTLDPRLEIEVPTTVTSARIDLVLSNSFGFGGQNAVLAIARP